MEKYYPKNNDPEVAIKIKLHVFQYSKEDPRNYTVADTLILQEQIKLINSFYQYLDPPTLSPPREIDFISDAKIRFVLCGIDFYVDSLLWDRISYKPHAGGRYPLPVDSVDVNKNIFYVKDNFATKFRAGAELHLGDCGTNTGRFVSDSCYYDKSINYTIVRPNKKLNPNQAKGTITFYNEQNYNCSNDIWVNKFNSDKNYLHIFYTGSSFKVLAFGCGPSPYFLNVSNFTNGGDWANAQLAAHELGHCIGLRHTDSPQFDDLPKKDKFGFIECDTIEVSNNIMGYNKCRRYLSPKQIASVHQIYNTDPSRIQTTIYCDYDWKNSMTINRSTTWDRAYVIGGDLIIRKNKTLVVRGMISMPKNGRIILEDGAKIIVDGVIITNNCGETWNGIVYCKKYKGKSTKLKKPKKRGVVEFVNGGKLNLVQEN